jgi:GDPmannose 4,6-dehydratase
MKAAFITGVNGQDGSYLSEYLLDKGYHVYGLVRAKSMSNTSRIDHITSNNFTLMIGDVTDSNSLYQCFDRILGKQKHPYLEVYHLAAQSHVKMSYDLPEYTCEVNAMGTLKLLETCRRFKDHMNIKMYFAGTSELYGEVTQIPQDENTPFNPCSPYAISKQFAFYMCKNYRDSYSMFISCGILFNHESPRRGSEFVTKTITDGVNKGYVELGNIDSSRDWGHAMDYVRAMHMMLQADKPDDFVVATGETHTVREFVEKAFKLNGIEISWTGERGTVHETGVDQNGVTRVKVNPEKYRPVDVCFLLGNAKKAREVLGWEPTITFDNLINEMVNYKENE